MPASKIVTPTVGTTDPAATLPATIDGYASAETVLNDAREDAGVHPFLTRLQLLGLAKTRKPVAIVGVRYVSENDNRYKKPQWLFLLALSPLSENTAKGIVPLPETPYNNAIAQRSSDAMTGGLKGVYPIYVTHHKFSNKHGEDWDGWNLTDRRPDSSEDATDGADDSLPF